MSIDNKSYKCNWCSEVSTDIEWEKATRDLAESNEEDLGEWSISVCDCGDSVCCPICGAEDEFSELVEG
jgi:hypothetical protein